jgi:hypothetical protein
LKIRRKYLIPEALDRDGNKKVKKGKKEKEKEGGTKGRREVSPRRRSHYFPAIWLFHQYRKKRQRRSKIDAITGSEGAKHTLVGAPRHSSPAMAGRIFRRAT